MEIINIPIDGKSDKGEGLKGKTLAPFIRRYGFTLLPSLFSFQHKKYSGNLLHPNTAQRGFTLLETLVALAVLAIALGAILRTAGTETHHTEELRLRLLADWIAQNRAALHAARGDWIAIGTQSGEETQAGIRFLWREEISDTPNPSFRRIEVGVYAPENDKYALRKLTGYLVEIRRN